MKKKGTVGKSQHRTPFKHWILETLLNKTGWALAYGRSPSTSDQMIFDLCAGDAQDKRSSPMIILKHAKKFRGKIKKIVCVFFEKATFNYDALKQNVAKKYDQETLKSVNYFAFNKSGEEALQYLKTLSTTQVSLFLNIDPNNIGAIPVKQFIEYLPIHSIAVCTLGCNVGGLKRNSVKAEGMAYKAFGENIPSWHDSLIVKLNKDNSQWAYLIRLPNVWSATFQTELQQTGDRMWPHGVTVASYRHSNDRWSELFDELFLTKTELQNEERLQTAI